ncbi:hypothetical protein B0H16DRAFT_1510188 [Mycena metata]|uniref:P-loop containing nucleoside triphosphate hydrolase protein n=1 Tax=Mycena metata TaxID=1033252 RepID=A0AAD7JXL9_9AGAR|nr:hypothetical protein B0H16DRAFT_1510188 [Mycena metata]
MSSPWSDTLILPLYVGATSIVLLVLHVLLESALGRRLRSLHTQLSGVDDHELHPEHHVQKHDSQATSLRTARLVGCLLLLGLSTAALVLEDIREIVQTPHPHLKASMCGLYSYTVFLSLFSISANAKWSRVATRHLNPVLFCAFAVYFYRDIFPLATVTLAPMDRWEGRLLWPKIALLFAVSCAIPLVMPREYVPLDPKSPMPVTSPEQTASVLSSVLYFWLDPIISLAYRIPHLNLDQLPPLCDFDHAEVLKARAFPYLDAFTSGKKRHVLFGFLRVFGWEALGMATLLAVAALANFLSPLAINRILTHLESPDAESLMRPWFWILLLFLGPLIYALAFEWQSFIGSRVMVQMSAIITELVFEHALRMRVKAETATGNSVKPTTQAAAKANLLTLITVDLNNISEGRNVLMLVVTVPIQVVGCIVFLYQILGWSALVGMATIIVLLPLPAYAAKLLSGAQAKMLQRTDARIQTFSEVMNVMRMTKMFGWQKQMHEKMAQKREEELTWIWRRKMLYTATGTVNFVVPTTVMTVILGQPLTAARVFSAMAVLLLLNAQLWYISYYTGVAVKARVSLNRLDAFLNETELLDSFSSTNTLATADEDQSTSELVGFRDATFSWANDDGALAPSNNRFILRIEGELLFKPGFNLVVGPTGSGKTSLLMALLGEMHFIPTSTTTSWFNLPRAQGVSYAAQESWVLNDTIKNNILFNAPMDQQRYAKVVHSCCLERDLQLFDAGDETEVGEKGLTLSGGQKARLTLARAVYANSKVVILDDVLAALDVHTARWVVEKCLAGDLMKDRAVILVTHNIAMTSKLADFVVSVGSDGRVHGQVATEKVLAQVSKDQAIVQAVEQELDSTASTEKITEGTGKLVVAEEIEIGHVSWEAWNMFVSAHGNPVVFLGIMVFAMVCIMILGRMETWYMGYWASQYEEGKPVAVFKYLAGYCLLVLADIVLYWIAYIYFTLGSFKASTSIHKELTDSVMGSTFRWLDVTPTSRILARFSGDLNTVDESLSDGLWSVNERTLEVLSLFVAVLIFTPAFLVPGLLVGLMAFACGRIFMAAQLGVKREMSTTKAPVLAHVDAAMTGLASVRAYGAQDTVIKISLNRINRLTRASLTFYNLNRWVTISLSSLHVQRMTLVLEDLLGALFATLLAYYLVYFQSYRAFNIGFVLNTAIGFTRAIMQWTRWWNNFEVQSNSIERIKQFVDIEQETKPTASGVPPAYWPASGTLSVHNLSARYSPDGPEVLHDISFNIKSGERVGIVGRTGSGKSSLTFALLRCIPTEGTVYYDGLLTSSLNLDALRGNVTIIPQTPELLVGSLRANLDIGGQFEDAVLNDALRAAGLSALQEEAEEGKLTLDSEISAGGNNLSVGQRQIIALGESNCAKILPIFIPPARAIVRRNYKTDAVIQSSLRNELPRDTTLLTVAHRLHSIMDADRIMVLDAGRIAEFDSPKVLLQDEGSMFRALVDESGDKEQLYMMVA